DLARGLAKQGAGLIVPGLDGRVHLLGRGLERALGGHVALVALLVLDVALLLRLDVCHTKRGVYQRVRPRAAAPEHPVPWVASCRPRSPTSGTSASSRTSTTARRRSPIGWSGG